MELKRGNEALVRSTLESNRRAQIASALAKLAPDHWILGTFDVRSRLTGALVSDATVTRRSAYDMLFVSGESAAAEVVSATVATNDGGAVRVLALYDRAGSGLAPPGAADLLAAIAEKLLADSAVPFTDASESEAITRRHWPHIAICELDARLQMLASWFPQRTAVADLVELVKPAADGRLPGYVLDSVRAIVKDWDWSDAKRCRERTASPVPEILLRVVPAAAEGATRALVLFEALQTRHVLRKASHYYGISQREEQVVDFLLEGHTIGEIARALVLAESTVQDHVKHVIAKTGSNNRVQMAARLLGWASGTRAGDTPKP